VGENRLPTSISPLRARSTLKRLYERTLLNFLRPTVRSYDTVVFNRRKLKVEGGISRRNSRRLYRCLLSA